MMIDECRIISYKYHQYLLKDAYSFSTIYTTTIKASPGTTPIGMLSNCPLVRAHGLAMAPAKRVSGRFWVVLKAVASFEGQTTYEHTKEGYQFYR
ncbi:hypothetical protein BrE312_0540 [Brenneria sp. EniD312]|nr:hypothetical protein BrE312_0540 [Brenneria sp. EniD312]